MKRLFLISLILGSHAFKLVIPQDGHYWSDNYGNRSMLLSGTVNASVEDLGLVFYNPARLGMIENPAFAISAKVYEWRTLKVEENSEEIELKNSSFSKSNIRTV